MATVPQDFEAYSSQSSFLRPVKATAKVSYQVDRTADGRTFATRLVRATQTDTGPCLYVAIISFQRRGGSSSAAEQNAASKPSYAVRPPDLGGSHPDNTPRFDLQGQLGFQINEDELPANMQAQEAFDWRLLPLKTNDDLAQIRAYGFIRFSTQSRTAYLPSMAMLSDQSLLELAIFANWKSTSRSIQSLAMNTTLNSQVSFHVSAVESPGWMVCESRTSWGAGGRMATHQQFWDLETGVLLMSCTQDALLTQPSQPSL